MGRRNKGYRASRALGVNDLDRFMATIAAVSKDAHAERYCLVPNDRRTLHKLARQRATVLVEFS